jgi:hypothetical protein
MTPGIGAHYSHAHHALGAFALGVFKWRRLAILAGKAEPSLLRNRMEEFMRPGLVRIVVIEIAVAVSLAAWAAPDGAMPASRQIIPLGAALS